MDEFNQVSGTGARLQEWLNHLQRNPRLNPYQSHETGTNVQQVIVQRTQPNQPLQQVQPIQGSTGKANQAAAQSQNRSTSRDSATISTDARLLAANKLSTVMGTGSQTDDRSSSPIGTPEAARLQVEATRRAMLEQVNRAVEAQGNIAPTTLLRLMR